MSLLNQLFRQKKILETCPEDIYYLLLPYLLIEKHPPKEILQDISLLRYDYTINKSCILTQSLSWNGSIYPLKKDSNISGVKILNKLRNLECPRMEYEYPKVWKCQNKNCKFCGEDKDRIRDNHYSLYDEYIHWRNENGNPVHDIPMYITLKELTLDYLVKLRNENGCPKIVSKEARPENWHKKLHVIPQTQPPIDFEKINRKTKEKLEYGFDLIISNMNDPGIWLNDTTWEHEDLVPIEMICHLLWVPHSDNFEYLMLSYA